MKKVISLTLCLLMLMSVFAIGFEAFAVDDGWVQEGTEKYYYVNGEKICNTWYTIDEKNYYFDNYGRMWKEGIHNYNDYIVLITKSGALAGTTWYQDNDGKKYYFKDGVAVLGWQTIGGKRYYFNERYGYMYKDGSYNLGEWNREIYLFTKSGALAGTQWSKESGDDERFYNARTNGGGGWFYYKNGKRVEGGWQKIDGKWYYLDSHYYGKMVSNGVELIDEEYYYFNKDGSLGGTKWIKYNGTYAYAVKGKLITGWKKIDGKWYCFYQKSRTMMGEGLHKIDGKYYLFNSKGQWMSGKNGWLYLRPEWHYIVKGVAVQGWKKIKGKWYYFDKYSEMLSNGICGVSKSDGTFDGYYLFNSDGALCGTQWYYDADYNHYHYFQNGKMIRNQWKKIAGYWYYFDDLGYMMCGDWEKIDGKWYYFNYDGTYNSAVTARGKYG